MRKEEAHCAGDEEHKERICFNKTYQVVVSSLCASGLSIFNFRFLKEIENDERYGKEYDVEDH